MLLVIDVIQFIFPIISVFMGVKTLNEHKKNLPYFEFLVHFISCFLFAFFIPSETPETLFVIWSIIFIGILIDVWLPNPVFQILNLIAGLIFLLHRFYSKLISGNWTNWLSFLLTSLMVNGHFLAGLAYYSKMKSRSFQPIDIVVLLSINYFWAYLFVQALKKILQQS